MYRRYDFDYSIIGITGKLFPYSTKGFIKDSPSDFKVIEDACRKKKEENGKYTYFTLVKNDWTTSNALNKIAGYCHVSWKRFNFAGTKDKHAVTQQLISVKGVNAETLKKLKIKDLELKDFFQSNEELKLGELYGNKFIVKVNDYESKNAKGVLEKFEEFIRNGVPNYYGEQRFGIQRPDNHLIGKLIIREDYENALKELLAQTYPQEGEVSANARNYLMNNWGKWEEAYNKFPKYLRIERIILHHLIKHPNDYVNAIRKLPKNIAKIFVYAYQSYIFNNAVSEMIKRGLLTSFELELPGYDSDMNKIGGAIIEEILEKEGVKLSDFKVTSYPEISCRGTKRNTLIFPEEFITEKIAKNNYTISFKLPKSSYATIVLRELIQ